MVTPTDDPCANCGECCSRQGTPPFMHTPDDCPPPHLEWDIGQHADRYDLELPCLWYNSETKRCNHYEHRPQVCREFAPGEPACNDFRGRVSLPLLPAVPERWQEGDGGYNDRTAGVSPVDSVDVVGEVLKWMVIAGFAGVTVFLLWVIGFFA